MTRKASLLAVVILMLASCTSIAQGAWEGQSWQYHRGLNIEQDGFVLIELDKGVMDHARFGFADLRLVDAQGTEIPYQLVERGLQSRAAYDARLFDVAVVPGEYNILSLDLGESGHLHNRIEMEVSYEGDYLRSVKIEGSDDNQTWMLLGEDKLFRVGKDLVKNYLEYPECSFRYLRLNIQTGGEKTLLVKNARVLWESAGQNGSSRSIPVNVLDLQNNSKDKSTDIIIDLGSGSYQVESLLMEINGRNFKRTVQCLESVDQKDWALIGEGQIMDYQWDNYSYQNHRIKVGKMCQRYIKLRIFNQDSPALDIKEFDVKAFTPQIIADLQPGQYVLWYGNRLAKAPAYDLGKFSVMIDKDSLPVVYPAGEELNSAYNEPLEPWTERNKWLLNVAVTAAALALGFVIYKTLHSTVPKG